jgi:hypothetical protein
VFGGDESAAGKVFKSTSDAMDAIKQYAGDKLKDIGSALPQLADMAVKYALPIGIIIAIIYGGSKLIGALTDDIEVSENKDLLRIKSLAGL